VVDGKCQQAVKTKIDALKKWQKCNLKPNGIRETYSSEKLQEHETKFMKIRRLSGVYSTKLNVV